MSLLTRLSQAAKDRRGNVAIIFGFTVLPLVVAVGVGIDYGRALVVRERMVTALDAAALAVGSWKGLTQAQAEEKTKAFFHANYKDSGLATITDPVIVDNGATLDVSVSATVQTTLMNIVGIPSVAVSVSTEVTKEQGTLELVLALDNTGSMLENDKIGALKTAARELVKILFEDQATSDTVKIGLVPFSGAVNVGWANRTATWIDLAGGSAISKENFKTGSVPNPPTADTLFTQMQSKGTFTKVSEGVPSAPHGWRGCVRERAEPDDVTDKAPTTATLKWPLYLAPDEPGLPPGNSGNPSGTTYIPAYCSTAQRFCNDYMNDDPNSGISDVRQRTTSKYNKTSANKNAFCQTTKVCGFTLDFSVLGKTGPNFNCPTQAIQPLTNVKATIDTAIDGMQGVGNTVIPESLAWAWRVISPTDPFTQGKAYSDTKNTKAIILLTDGENDVKVNVPGVGEVLTNGHNGAVYNAFGFPKEGHLGATNGTQAVATLNAKTTTLCNNIKAPGVGIRVYTIGFDVDTASIKTLLEGCATTPKMYYNSPSNEQLKNIFKEIALGLNNLRVSK